MKTIRLILPLILLVCVLCGCSSRTETGRVPYLEQKEREKIEKGILNSLEIVEEKYTRTACFDNNSNYTLLDVQLVFAENDTTMLSIPYLEKKTSGKIKVYNQELEGDGVYNVYLVYTVGEYTYYSDLKVPVRKVAADETSTPKPQIMIKTQDGMRELDYSAPLEFFAGTEIAGLKKCRIYSVFPEVPYEDGLTVYLTGSKPDNFYKTVVAKLWDEDGIVVATNSVYFNEKEATLYFFDVTPGNYTLTFEEEK